MTRNAQSVTYNDYLAKMDNPIIDEDTGVAMEYRRVIKKPKLRLVWIKSLANEIGILSQGVCGRLEVTDTIFLPHKNITENRRKYVTYGQIVVDY